jgi:succinate dehydrogenase / fumarate reductase flavoprotein subunit/fumarate reductase flavoprotein subunit
LIVWEKVGLVRNGADLKLGLSMIDELAERLERCSVTQPLQYNLAWQEVHNVKNMIQIARMIAVAAINRTESRGSHFRTDYAITDNVNWYKNIFMKKGSGDELELDIKAVEFTHKSPEEIFGDEARATVAAS